MPAISLLSKPPYETICYNRESWAAKQQAALFVIAVILGKGKCMLEMDWKEYMEHWQQAAVKLFDVRRRVMGEGDTLDKYQLPASAFLYIIRGSATIWLDDAPHQANRFYWLYGHKVRWLLFRLRRSWSII
jgi:hypothetical protein